MINLSFKEKIEQFKEKGLIRKRERVKTKRKKSKEIELNRKLKRLRELNDSQMNLNQDIADMLLTDYQLKIDLLTFDEVDNSLSKRDLINIENEKSRDLYMEYVFLIDRYTSHKKYECEGFECS